MKGRKPNITALHGALDKAPPAPASALLSMIKRRKFVNHRS